MTLRLLPLVAFVGFCAASDTGAEIIADDDGNLLVTSAEGKTVLVNGHEVVTRERFESLNATAQAQVSTATTPFPTT